MFSYYLIIKKNSYNNYEAIIKSMRRKYNYYRGMYGNYPNYPCRDVALYPNIGA